MKKKKKNSLKTKFINFIKSYKAIILALIIITIILLIFSNHLMRSSKTYLFSGKSDNVVILNGVISLNYDVNLLQGSDIEYINDEDYSVTEYKIGYYINEGNKLLPLAIKNGKDEIGLSLKGILNEMSAYNISEPYHNHTYFTKEKIKSLEKGLYFIIEAKTTEGEEILDKIELSLSKVSK